MTDSKKTLWATFSPRGTLSEKMHGGKRFVTEWDTSDGQRFMVSSVDHDTACETMIFAVVDGEATYYDLWTDRVFRDTRHSHGKFLDEFLSHTNAEGVGPADGMAVRIVPPELSEFTENSP